MFIYVLSLEEGKYYIGKTTNPNFRLQDHFYGNGSYWTKKYKPLSIVKILQNCDSFDEDKLTIQYMSLYGIDNVRGGSFCQISLSPENIITLNQMIQGSQDLCYKCGQPGHFSRECPNVALITSYEEVRCRICNSNWHRTEEHVELNCCSIS